MVLLLSYHLHLQSTRRYRRVFFIPLPDLGHVQDVAETGCDIVAVMGGAGFLFGDADLSPEDYRAVEPQILAIGEK
jgi:hypothetical protein